MNSPAKVPSGSVARYCETAASWYAGRANYKKGKRRIVDETLPKDTSIHPSVLT